VQQNERKSNKYKKIGVYMPFCKANIAFGGHIPTQNDSQKNCATNAFIQEIQFARI